MTAAGVSCIMNKSPRASVCFRLLVVALAVASAQTTIAQAPASVQLVPIFDAKQFQDPEAALWPAYFWLWNAPLDRQELRAQLRDMNVHGAKSVCMLPMPHAFRPDSTNNGLEPD